MRTLAQPLVGRRKRIANESFGSRLGIHPRAQKREQFVEQAEAAQFFKTGNGVTAEEQLAHLFQEAGGRLGPQQPGHFRNRLGATPVELAAEFGREARRTQHSHRVLLVAQTRFPDQAQTAPGDVLEPADVIDNALVGKVPVQRVDREIAPQHVLFQTAEAVVPQDAPVGSPDNRTLRIRGLVAGTAKRGDLDVFAAEHHVRESEPAPDQQHPAEQLLYLFRPGVGHDVEILGPEIQQQVAHAASDHAGAIACPVQAA